MVQISLFVDQKWSHRCGEEACGNHGEKGDKDRLRGWGLTYIHYYI